jgi:hypothetical protein
MQYTTPCIFQQVNATSLIHSAGEKQNMPDDNSTLQPSNGPGYEADE